MKKYFLKPINMAKATGVELNEPGSLKTGFYGAAVTKCEIFNEEIKQDKNGRSYNTATFQLFVHMPSVNSDKRVFFNFPQNLWNADSLVNQFRYATGLKSEDMDTETLDKNRELLLDTDTYVGASFVVAIGPSFDKENRVRMFGDNNDKLSLDILEIHPVDFVPTMVDEKRLQQLQDFANQQLQETKDDPFNQPVGKEEVTDMWDTAS